MTNQSRRMQANFREEDLQAVMGNVHAGKSTEIIGLGSVGKSNFVRRLLLPDVQERYLYQQYSEQSQCIFIQLDANNLLEPLPSALRPNEPSGWSGYELVTSRLLKAVMDANLLGHLTNTQDMAHPNELYKLYRRMWPSDNPHPHAHIVAFRYLEDMLQRIYGAANRNFRLIFILDEFEKMLAELPVHFFQTLRGLRDQYKDRLMYITTVRQITPLIIPPEKFLAYEPFIELFNDSRHFLLPYRPSDVDQTFERLAARQDYGLPSAYLREQLLAVTGGHAGLIRAAFSAWSPHRLLRDGLSDEELIRLLLGVASVVDECKTMWRSLCDAERQLLFDFARQHQNGQQSSLQAAQSPMARLLIRKGILLSDTYLGFPHIRPHIFAAFLWSILPPLAQKGETHAPNFPPEAGWE